MSILESIPIIGKLFEKSADIVDQFVVDKDKKNELLNTLNLAKLEAENSLLKEQASIVKLEAQGNWLQSSWRPIFALTIVAIIANNYLIFPYLNIYFPGKVVMLELPEKLWVCFQWALGGYIGARSIEKIMKKD